MRFTLKTERYLCNWFSTGRIGHPLNHTDGAPLQAPSAVQATGLIRTPGNVHLPIPPPEPLSKAEIKNLVDAHIKAAVSAIEIGFDGVEIHGAHGFLAAQFLHPQVNRRIDEYGGSIEKRSRFLLEILEGVAGAIGKEHTGVRLSPFAGINDQPPYAEEAATHRYLADAMQQIDIAYIHFSAVTSGGHSSIPTEYIRTLRKDFRNLMILAGGYTAASAEAAIKDGLADLIAFGKPFISNPDLVERFRHNIPLTSWDESTFYEGGDKGYIDYPVVHHAAKQECLK